VRTTGAELHTRSQFESGPSLNSVKPPAALGYASKFLSIEIFTS
jgi:hypothetical protein